MVLTPEIKYPPQYKNILIAAKLLGKGSKVVLAANNGKQKQDFDEESNTWVTVPGEYEVDYKGAQELPVPVVIGGVIQGDWRTGLTKDMIKIINEECGVPIFDKNYAVHVFHDRVFDMGSPKDVAEFRILVATGTVAPEKNKMKTNQRFYFHSPEELKAERREVRKAKAKAAAMSGEMSSTAKRMFLILANHKYRLGLPATLTEEEIHDRFDEMALGSDYKKLLVIEDLDNKFERVLACKCVAIGVVRQSAENGPISNARGSVLAENFEEFVDRILIDRSFKESLEREYKIKTGGFEAESAPEIDNGYDIEFEQEFDLNIYSEDTPALWTVDMCKAYFDAHYPEVKLSETDSVSYWRKAVTDHHYGRKNPVLEVEAPIAPEPVIEPTTEPITEDVKETEVPDKVPVKRATRAKGNTGKKS